MYGLTREVSNKQQNPITLLKKRLSITLRLRKQHDSLEFGILESLWVTSLEKMKYSTDIIRPI